VAVLGLGRERVVEILDGPIVLVVEVQHDALVATPLDLARVERERLVVVGDGIHVATIRIGPVGPRRVGQRALGGREALRRDDPVASCQPGRLLGGILAEAPVAAIVEILLVGSQRRFAREQGGEQDRTEAAHAHLHLLAHKVSRAGGLDVNGNGFVASSAPGSSR
jgi:hypothetical protein